MTSRGGFDKAALPSRHVTEGPYKALQRSFFYALGLSEQEIHHPIVGVASAWDGASRAGDAPLRVAAAAEDGVWTGGATPRRFATVAGADASASGSGQALAATLVGRELVADSVELTVRGHSYDALVGIASAPLAVAGLALGACRLDVPAVVVPIVGPQLGSEDECYAVAAMMLAVGLALSPRAAEDAARSNAGELELGQRSGVAVTGLIRSGQSARRLVGAASLRNGAAMLAAIGAAPDTAIHLAAIAGECGIDLGLAQLAATMETTPQLWRSPAEAAAARGGTAAAIAALIELGHLDGDCPTATGATLAESSAGPAGDPPAPLASPGGTAWSSGPLAPGGALVSHPPGSLCQLAGRARVFEDEDAASAWIAADRCAPDTVLVVRGVGPAGAPGMRCLARLAAELAQPGRTGPALVVTDGRMPRTDAVVAVTAVGPEAALGGPLALLSDGDAVRLDRDSHLLDVDLAAGTPAYSEAPAPARQPAVLARYRATVGPASAGAPTHPGARAETVRYADLP